MSRPMLVLVTIIAGLAVAVGVSYAAIALVSQPPVPTNQSCCNYS
ncbi:MAG TPA: hypothetical protein VEL03_18025 [Streptosporangiaceae bacterium]|nr:hypothetical protein [Streptosporangiaceae bacterium]